MILSDINIIQISGDTRQSIIEQSNKMNGELVWNTPERVVGLNYYTGNIYDYFIGAVLLKNYYVK